MLPFILKTKTGQSNNIVRKVLALHTDDMHSVPEAPYGPLSPIGLISVCRARCVAPK